MFERKRREFITLLGGAAAWPLAARAQQPMRRIGVLTPFAADDAEGDARLSAFTQGLDQSGWIVGQNIQIDYRRGDGKAATMRKLAAELVARAPEVILVHRFQNSNHIRRLDRVCRTMCERRDPG